MRSANGPDTATHRLETRSRLESIHTLVVGDGSNPGLCEQVRALSTEQSHLRSDIRTLSRKTDSFDAKLDKLLERAKSEAPKKRKSIFAVPKLRSSLFIIGALGDIGLAVHASIADGGFTWTHAIAAAFTALAGFSLKWPTDVTKAEADEREQKARMSSAPPPP
jgi:hypothetical protein